MEMNRGNEAGFNEAMEAVFTPRSVVDPKRKVEYAENAKRKGRRDKAAYRGCDDWMARQLAKKVLTDDKARKLLISELEAILDANGVDHSKWSRTAKGWQGLLRMTGGIALRRRVAEAGVLRFPDGDSVAAPKAWCERNWKK